MAKQPRTSISITEKIKCRLDENRSPGQCYNGFICQLVDLWEENKAKERRIMNNPAGSARRSQGAGARVS
jgi:hypothetical protein